MKYKKIYGLYGHLYGNYGWSGSGFPKDLRVFCFLNYDPNDMGIYPVWDGNPLNSWGPYFYSRDDRKKWYKRAIRLAKENSSKMTSYDWQILHYMGHCKLKPYWHKVENENEKA